MVDSVHTQALTDNLGKLCEQLGQLYKILLLEESALAKNNYTDIEHLAAQKIQLTQQVEQTEQQRRIICQQLNINANIEGLRALVKQTNSNDKANLIKLWQRVTTLGQHCSTQNQVNGILVNHQQRHAREALNILRGHFGITNMYSNRGAQESEQPRHSLGKV